MNQIGEVQARIPNERIPEIEKVIAVPTMLNGHPAHFLRDIVCVYRDGGRTVLMTMVLDDRAEEIVAGVMNEILKIRRKLDPMSFEVMCDAAGVNPIKGGE